MIYKNVVIKSYLKHFRQAAKLSQWDLAALVGCSDTMIQLIEYGKTMPNLKLAYCLSAVISEKVGYSVSITDIFHFISN